MKFRNRNLIVKPAIRPMIEGLENRRMLSASLNHHGLLNVGGTGRHDEIAISMDATNPTLMDVSINGKVTSYDSSKINRIRINAAGGNDTVSIDSSVTDPCTVLGGAGNDTLVAGGGDDSLNGGAGDDLLEAGGGHDILKGAAGHDHLVGGTGDALLDGGAGNDSLEGGAGDDSLLGGIGDDSIVTGTGNDHIDGGKGRDRIDFDANSGVALDTLPAAVQTGLTTLAHGATIPSVLVFQEHGQTNYAAQVTVNGVATRIVVNASGNPVTQLAADHGGHSDR